MSVLNAAACNASFLDELNTQFFEQTVIDTIVAPVVEEAPKAKPKAKTVEVVESEK
jgi:RsiW-degrading membrane proteinase PrsW (M82 family)